MVLIFCGVFFLILRSKKLYLFEYEDRTKGETDSSNLVLFF